MTKKMDYSPVRSTGRSRPDGCGDAGGGGRGGQSTFEVPAEGPLTITEGVEAPADCPIEVGSHEH